MAKHIFGKVTMRIDHADTPIFLNVIGNKI